MRNKQTETKAIDESIKGNIENKALLNYEDWIEKQKIFEFLRRHKPDAVSTRLNDALDALIKERLIHYSKPSVIEDINFFQELKEVINAISHCSNHNLIKL